MQKSTIDKTEEILVDVHVEFENVKHEKGIRNDAE